MKKIRKNTQIRESYAQINEGNNIDKQEDKKGKILRVQKR